MEMRAKNESISLTFSFDHPKFEHADFTVHYKVSNSRKANIVVASVALWAMRWPTELAVSG